jgi:hypothetical protein
MLGGVPTLQNSNCLDVAREVVVMLRDGPFYCTSP